MARRSIRKEHFGQLARPRALVQRQFHGIAPESDSRVGLIPPESKYDPKSALRLRFSRKAHILRPPLIDESAVGTQVCDIIFATATCLYMNQTTANGIESGIESITNMNKL